MKMPKEYTLIVIAGMFLLSYVLEATVDPLAIELATPFEFLKPLYLSQYPFTAATVGIRSIALFMTPLWLLSFIKKAHYGKGGTILILAALMQLYSLQEIATGTTLVPLEWSLSLSIAGAALLLPAALFILSGMFAAVGEKMAGDSPSKTSDESLED